MIVYLIIYFREIDLSFNNFFILLLYTEDLVT
jgi:hypothetical protein